MNDPQFSIERVRPWDLLTLTQMAYANMTGVDREFTRSTSGPVAHALGYVILPLYLLTAGRGYKATTGNEIAGCAFLHIRRLSGFAFNVNVNAPFRRKGIGRALMEHLEREVRRLGRRWMGLHLDDGNIPAQELYESLGYRQYHHRFLRSQSPVILQEPQSPGVQARPLSRVEGVRLWKRRADLARHEGDTWAARVVREDFDEGPPPGGTFWRCYDGDKEAGCAWLGGAIKWPVISLLLDGSYWNRRSLTVTLLNEVLQNHSAYIEGIDLHLGSSAHHDVVQGMLRHDGFTTHNRARILMLKELAL